MKREKPLLYNYIISLTEICFAFIKINILYIDQYIVQSEESANLLGTETISVWWFYGMTLTPITDPNDDTLAIKKS